jgi:uncharacterized tellurite resistance protein B-like protein
VHDESKRAAFINGLILIHADGVSDPRERAVLWQFKDEAGISDQLAIRWYERVRGGALDLQPLHRTGDALRMIELLAEIALADGVVSTPERTVIRQVAKACGLSDFSLAEITGRIWGGSTSPVEAP